jgi:hypothetical protein
MIRGSAIAPHVDGIWACEFIENPLQPGFLQSRRKLPIEAAEIAQIGMVIDNTTKTRAIFEINKGTNKNAAIDVNAKIRPEDRRIPFQNMIYIADGPSDVPSFSVVKKGGGKTYAVYNPDKSASSTKRPPAAIRSHHGYGPADYAGSEHRPVAAPAHPPICDRHRGRPRKRPSPRGQSTKPPRHLNATPEEMAASRAAKAPKQDSFLE